MAHPTSLNSSSKAFLVEKLNVINYSLWSIKNELLLISNDCFTIVDGSESDHKNVDLVT